MKKCKIRLQGDKEIVEQVRAYLLKNHPGLILSTPRQGTNPLCFRPLECADNQKYSSYGYIEFHWIGPKRQREKKRKTNHDLKGAKNEEM